MAHLSNGRPSRHQVKSSSAAAEPAEEAEAAEAAEAAPLWLARPSTAEQTKTAAPPSRSTRYAGATIFSDGVRAAADAAAAAEADAAEADAAEADAAADDDGASTSATKSEATRATDGLGESLRSRSARERQRHRNPSW